MCLAYDYTLVTPLQVNQTLLTKPYTYFCTLVNCIAVTRRQTEQGREKAREKGRGGGGGTGYLGTGKSKQMAVKTLVCIFC